MGDPRDTGTAALLDWLFSVAEDRHVYFLADCARDERLYPLVQSSWLDQACLYDGDLPLEFRRVAPHLLRLERSAEETVEILELGWGDAWGVFCQSASPLDALKSHFRQFLTVRDEGGRTFFFRFFDPRVLRVYLPTCTPPELDEIFGPVEAFLLEGDGGQRMRFRKHG
jgi:hypothetical protein